MEEFPNELKYSSTHEWCRKEDDGTYTIGITDFAQQSLGEIVFVELPDLNVNVSSGDEVCVVESVKAASDIYSPISGNIVAINEELTDAPSTINAHPYADGWLYKIKPDDESELKELLSADDYSSGLDENG